MCGRSTYKLTWEEIVRLYRLTLDQPPVNTRARYNVCPTTTIDTIVGQWIFVPTSILYAFAKVAGEQLV